MPTIEEVIFQQRSALMVRESSVLRTISQGYDRVLSRLERDAVRILNADTFPQIVRQAQLLSLIDDAEQQMQLLGGMHAKEITAAQHALILQSASDMITMLRSVGLAPKVNFQAAARISAAVQPESPLARLLAANSIDAGEAAKQILVTGTIIGDNPLKIASELRTSMTTPKYGAERIARTEILRSYRGAMQERISDAGFSGGVWVCAPDACAYCWAMSGSIYPSEQAMDTHPNCRCSWAPNLGPDNNFVRPGEEAFAQLPEARQLSILGPAKFNAYQSGAITLNSLAGHAVSSEWGNIGFERSLKDALGQGVSA